MKANRLARAYESAVNALSFSSELYRLRRELNARIDQPESLGPAPSSHLLGLSRWFKRRRISIAESYIRVVRELDSSRSKARLRALRMMVDVSFHAKTLDMPLNTARVQLALVKEAVKQRGDRRRQLELLRDFSVSSHGQYQVIRRLLDELNMIELPETGRPLRELDAGWDLHVHDSATSGRKNPTQLLIDAFIKGISELTIAYAGPSSLEAMAEAVEAGRIVGIRVRVGLEFSLNREGRRFHFMALLPETRRGEDLVRFFEERGKRIRGFLEGLEENREHRVESVRRLLRNFNETYLGLLNEGFPDRRAYRIPRLRMRELSDFIPNSGLNRMHLGDFLYYKAKPVLFNRVLLLKVQRERAARDLARGLVSDWDYRVALGKYERARADFRDLSPEALRRRYFSNPLLGDYASVFDDLEGLREELGRAGCGIRVLHPLEHGLDKALALLSGAEGLIDEVEVYNMQDSVLRDPEEILELCRRVNELNLAAEREGRPPLVPVCGSDATGRSPEIPGMGFVFAERIAGRRSPAYLRRHVALPAAVARLVAARGRPVDMAAGAPSPRLLSMGKVSEGFRNRIGDEEDGGAAALSLPRALRYLNPSLVNLLHAAVGFLVARHFVGDGYALLWLGITGFRNAIADLVAGWGTRFREWSLKGVNFDNIARSLFWTGFSVPILGFVKERFDLLWPLAASGLLYDAARFFFISGTNGLYLAAHNKLRGFDRSVIRANLFRSALSWPFAALAAPLGNLLGVPAIVQSKIWSDVVAGFIEGGNKYFKILKLRRRDLEGIVPRLGKGNREERATALLDLLYLWREEPRTRASLAAVLERGGRIELLPALPRQRGPGLPAAPPAEPEEAGPYEALLAAVSDERTDRRLLDFILASYSHEVAVDLASLVARTLPEFRDWLALRRPGSPPAGIRDRASREAAPAGGAAARD